eukprot:gene12506-13791_t
MFEEVTEMMLRVEETAGFEDARLLKGEFSKWYKVYIKMIKMLEDDIDDLFEELTTKMDGVYKSLPHIRNSGGGECWRQVWWLITVWDFVTPILTWEKILELVRKIGRDDVAHIINECVKKEEGMMSFSYWFRIYLLYTSLIMCWGDRDVDKVKLFAKKMMGEEFVEEFGMGVDMYLQLLEKQNEGKDGGVKCSNMMVDVIDSWMRKKKDEAR